MKTRVSACQLVLSVLCFIPLRGAAQMIDPAIDRPDEPFCYFSQPTDVLGVMDGREGTLVTPEGYLYTGYGELMFFTGNPPVPVRHRVKTLERGYLPIIHSTWEEQELRYSLTAFAATLDGDPESPLMNFIRVTVRNPTRRQRTAFFGAGHRYQNDANTDWGFGDNRFARPEQGAFPGAREQAGVAFNPAWTYALSQGAFLRDGKTVYLYPEDPVPEKRITLRTGDNTPFLPGPQSMEIPPTTPVGIVLYSLPLAPGRETTLDFAFPYAPLDSGSTDLAALRRARFDVYHRRTVEFWEGIFASSIDIDLPEAKVTEAFKANLVFDLVARNKEHGAYIQKVNEFQYDAFWLRDASYIVRMYDLSGLHTIARQCLDFCPRWPRDDGNFVSHGGQFDGWGQTLWAYGRHYRITRDTAFARSFFPSVRRAVAWLTNARRSDPLGLIPVTTPGDNEDISGHVTGHNFWALAGLKNAATLAEAVGDRDAAAAIAAESEDFRSTFLGHLRRVTRTTGGAIPPGLDTPGGQDWGNMLSVYPEEILDPHDPMVTATLQATRAKYQEGIMTYGNGRWLHHYLTMKNTETEVIRGDQENAIRELYALLLHTASTHTGFEYCILPWGTRDFGMNLAPHGWFSAKLRALVRNMMVREQGNDLHLLSCLSPAWVRDGASIALRRAPTDFGRVEFTLRCTSRGARLSISPAFVREPESVILHLPWFVKVHSVRAAGSTLPVRDGIVRLPPGAREVDIVWTRRPGVPAIDFDNTVSAYKEEYRRRYADFLTNGIRTN
jgi:hypothetical protein